MSATTNSSTDAGEMLCSIGALGRQSASGRSRSYRRRTQRTSTRRGRRGRGASKSRGVQTAFECSAEDITEESVLLHMAEEYVTSILPDPSTVLTPTNHDAHQYQPLSPGGPGGVRHRSKRRTYCQTDHYVVTLSQQNKCGLPAGTKVMRPDIKLVQMVAQAIYFSPSGLLRVNHIYDALQKKYPYFMFLQKKALSSWKSSIRHALFQRWFIKLRISSEPTCRRPRCYYWGLNFNSRPREWTMPGVSYHDESKREEVVDVEPFDEDLTDALMDDSTALEWLVPLEDGMPVTPPSHPPAGVDAPHVPTEFQYLSSFTDMDVGTVSLLSAEGPDGPMHQPVVSQSLPCPMEGPAEWLPNWDVDWPADWWTMPLGLPLPAPGD